MVQLASLSLCHTSLSLDSLLADGRELNGLSPCTVFGGIVQSTCAVWEVGAEDVGRIELSNGDDAIDSGKALMRRCGTGLDRDNPCCL